MLKFVLNNLDLKWTSQKDKEVIRFKIKDFERIYIWRPQRESHKTKTLGPFFDENTVVVVVIVLTGLQKSLQKG